MATTILKVDGMSCGHCVKAVQDALTALSGVNSAAVDLPGKTVTVEHAPAADLAAFKTAIEEQGFDVVG